MSAPADPPKLPTGSDMDADTAALVTARDALRREVAIKDATLRALAILTGAGDLLLRGVIVVTLPPGPITNVAMAAEEAALAALQEKIGR